MRQGKNVWDFRRVPAEGTLEKALAVQPDAASRDEP